jgi:hypothetical protein
MTVTAITETIKSLNQVESLFDLNRATTLDFFPEWRKNLPELSEGEKVSLDRIKTSYLYNSADGSLTESTINLLLVSPLLYLAGLCDPPFKVRGEKAVEIAAEEENQILRGRIDALVLQGKIWLILVESKQAKFSFSMALPQALTYMMGSPNAREPLFGLVTNGDGFLFIKIIRQPKPFYALSDDFSLFCQSRNELYSVLQILKRLGAIV